MFDVDGWREGLGEEMDGWMDGWRENMERGKIRVIYVSL